MPLITAVPAVVAPWRWWASDWLMWATPPAGVLVGTGFRTGGAVYGLGAAALVLTALVAIVWVVAWRRRPAPTSTEVVLMAHPATISNVVGER